MTFGLVQANSIQIPFRDDAFHCVVTSPPYWNLRDYGVPGQLGLERVHDCLGWATGLQCGACYVCHLVGVFREVRRVMRPDATLWLNLGDSYSSGGRGNYDTKSTNKGNGASRGLGRSSPLGIKPKDLVGIPWRVALALQADGWYLRSDVIWEKPNQMPESVTDRPTKAHEYVFLFSKSQHYFWDAEAVKEPSTGQTGAAADFKRETKDHLIPGQAAIQNREARKPTADNGTRNLRTVWTIPTQPYSGAHYATFPEALVERCVLAGTSAKGCCKECGAPWERVTEHKLSSAYYDATEYKGRDNIEGIKRNDTDRAGGFYGAGSTTTGWRAACAHGPEPVPCRVFDPFVGSGTTVSTANKLGRDGFGLDLSYQYLSQNALPRVLGR